MIGPTDTEAEEMTRAAKQATLASLASFVAHMHDDIVRIENTLDHTLQGVGIILATLNPDKFQEEDGALVLRIPIKREEVFDD